MTNTSYEGHLIASFTHMDKADAYYAAITGMGYESDDLSVFVSEAKKKEFEDSNMDETPTLTETAGAGTMIGGTLGAIVGIILGLGTNAIIPGLGIVVAGPLMGALVGAGAGGAAGGLIGALTKLGLDDDYAKKFAEDIEKGNVVIAVDPKSEDKDKLMSLAETFEAKTIYCTK